MNAAGKSDIGKKRTNNEDSVLVDLEHRIFLIADGMGGHSAGEVASSIAVKEAHSFLVSAARQAGTEDMLALLEEANLKAHAAIRKKAASDAELSGMGTTLAGVMIDGSRAFVCNTGDSRAYLLREDLRQLTQDHSVVNQPHMLTQALGTTREPCPFRQAVDCREGDTLLLCTDGLTGMLDDNEIALILRAHGSDPAFCAQALVNEANRKGGDDNISVIVVRY